MKNQTEYQLMATAFIILVVFTGFLLIVQKPETKPIARKVNEAVKAQPRGMMQATGLATGLSSTDSSTVNRQFTSTTVQPGGTVDVTLDVAVDNNPDPHYVYVIEEDVPQGWTIVSTPSSAAVSGNTIKIAFIEEQLGQAVLAQSEQFTYTVKAPSSSSSGVFEGVFLFDGMTDIDPIGGPTTIQVQNNCAHTYDNNPCDGKISDSELLTVASLWLQNQLSDMELLTVASIWLGGSQ